VQDKLFSNCEIYEIKKDVLNSPIVFAGFVGAGLVGPLSVGYMIDKLGMEEIAYIQIKAFASFNCFHARKTKASIPYIHKQRKNCLCNNM